MRTFALLLALPWAAAAAEIVPVGVNLGRLDDRSANLVFRDAFKRSAPWIPFPPASEFADSGSQVRVDDDGWPIEAPFDDPERGPQVVGTVMFSGMGGRYPSGEYTLAFKGSGEVRLSGDCGSRTISEAGTYKIRCRPSNAGIFLAIERSEIADPVRDLRFLLPGTAGKTGGGPFHPGFIASLKGFRIIRVAGLLRVGERDYPCDNNREGHEPDCVRHWVARTRPGYATQVGPRGVALEHAVDLANRAGADLWVNLIHGADEEYARSAAELLRRRLKRKKTLFLELSEEVWDPGNPQHSFFARRGREGGLCEGVEEDDSLECVRRAYVRDAVRIYRIFDSAFRKGGPRLEKILPTRLADENYTKSLIELLGDPATNPDGIMPDALAVSAVFGADAAASIRGGLADEAFFLAGEEIGTFRDFIIAQRSLASQLGVPLYAYKGGDAFLSGAAPGDPKHAVLRKAVRDPRMRALYASLFRAWFGNGGGFFVAAERITTDTRDPLREALIGKIEEERPAPPPEEQAEKIIIKKGPELWLDYVRARPAVGAFLGLNAVLLLGFFVKLLLALLRS